MNWIPLTDPAVIQDLDKDSFHHFIVIFKHSTRCSISSMILNRLERAVTAYPAEISFYFLDIIRYREISNALATKYSVEHESPQLLLLRNGECTYDESHNGISMQELLEQVANSIK